MSCAQQLNVKEDKAIDSTWVENTKCAQQREEKNSNFAKKVWDKGMNCTQPSIEQNKEEQPHEKTDVQCDVENVHKVHSRDDTRKKEEKPNGQNWQFSPPIGNAYVKSYVTIARSDVHTSEAYICVDNGANRTIADKKFAEEHFGKDFLKFSLNYLQPPTLRAVTGHKLNILGVIPVKFTFGTFSINHPVIIHDGEEGLCLLGNDMILDKINYEKGRFLAFGQGFDKVPIQYNLPSQMVGLKNNVVIAPNSTRICSVVTQQKSQASLEGREVVVQANNECNAITGLVIENVISHLQQGGVAKAMIVNNTNDQISLDKGQLIAKIDFISPTNNLNSGLQVLTTPEESDQLISMIHEAEERKELLEGIGEMFPQPHGQEIKEEGSNKKWIDRVKHDHLTHEEWTKLKAVLMRNEEAFARTDLEMGLCNYFKASLPMKENAGFLYLKPRPLPHAQQKEADKVVNNLLELGIIRPSRSPHATNIVCVKKKAINGVIKTRVCVDLRLCNSQSIPNRFPNLQLDEAMAKIGNATYRSSLDFKNGFHQIALDEKSIPYTAFHCNGALYEYVRLPFGYVSAMSLWTNLMHILCKGYEPSTYYSDDCMICTKTKVTEQGSNTFDRHLDDVEGMFERIIKAGLKLNPEKCEFAHHSSKPMDWLGFTIENSLLKPQESKISAIKNYETPQTQKQAHSFVSLASFYRRFIKSFAAIAKPIYNVIHAETFAWTKEADEAFNELKHILCTYPVLRLPQLDQPFQIWTDASGFAIGAVLTQIDQSDNKMHPVAYASRKFNESELKLSSPCKELLAIIYALTAWNMYICGMPTTLYSDCRAWSFLKMKEGISSRVSRLALLVQEYDLEIKFVQGAKNKAADAISRQYDTQDTRLESPESLKDPNLEFLGAPEIEESRTMKLTEYLQLCETYVQQFEEQIATINKSKMQAEVNMVEAIMSVTALYNEKEQNIKQAPPFLLEKYQQAYNACTTECERIALVTLQEHFFSLDGFKELQKTDARLAKIIKKLEAMERNARYRDGYFLHKGLLMKDANHEDGRKFRVLCLPRSLVSQVLSHYHGSLMRGHLGPSRLHGHLKSKFFWHSMKQDVQNFVDNCISCQYNAKYPVKFNMGTVVTPKYPNHIVHIDLMVGLPRSVDGYHAMLLCYDGFSRYSYGIPLRSEKSDYIVKLFYQFYCSAFMLPSAVHSDQAANLSNTVVNTLASILGIKKAITPMYNPRSNPCETLCGAMGDLLRKHLSKHDQKYWHLMVPMLLATINNTVHSQTGYTPASLMLGRFVENDTIPLVSCHEIPDNTDEYVLSMRRFQEYAFRLTRYKHKQTAEKLKDKLNKTSYAHKFTDGDFVLIKELQPAGRGQLKLRNKYRGPYRVIKANESSLIVIPWTENAHFEQNLKPTKKKNVVIKPVSTEVVPVSLCKPFRGNITLPPHFDESFVDKLLQLLGTEKNIDMRSIVSDSNVDELSQTARLEIESSMSDVAPPGGRRGNDDDDSDPGQMPYDGLSDTSSDRTDMTDSSTSTIVNLHNQPPSTPSMYEDAENEEVGEGEGQEFWEEREHLQLRDPWPPQLPEQGAEGIEAWIDKHMQLGEGGEEHPTAWSDEVEEEERREEGLAEAAAAGRPIPPMHPLVHITPTPPARQSKKGKVSEETRVTPEQESAPPFSTILTPADAQAAASATQTARRAVDFSNIGASPEFLQRLKRTPRDSARGAPSRGARGSPASRGRGRGALPSLPSFGGLNAEEAEMLRQMRGGLARTPPPRHAQTTSASISPRGGSRGRAPTVEHQMTRRSQRDTDSTAQVRVQVPDSATVPEIRDISRASAPGGEASRRQSLAWHIPSQSTKVIHSPDTQSIRRK